MADHDEDVIPRCRRLGQEMTFGYCRQEAQGKPCRWILDCWWERFDARWILQAHLTEDVMAQVEVEAASAPASKVLSLLDLVEQARERLALSQREEERPREG